MDLRPGSRFRSAVDSTEVVVVRAPAGPTRLECGGAAMIEATATAVDPAGPVDVAFSDGTLLGKRYVDPDGLGLEVLCTKAGQGSLAVDGRPLVSKSAKPLPSSD